MKHEANYFWYSYFQYLHPLSFRCACTYFPRNSGRRRNKSFGSSLRPRRMALEWIKERKFHWALGPRRTWMASVNDRLTFHLHRSLLNLTNGLEALRNSFLNHPSSLFCKSRSQLNLRPSSFYMPWIIQFPMPIWMLAVNKDSYLNTVLVAHSCNYSCFSLDFYIWIIYALIIKYRKWSIIIFS